VLSVSMCLCLYTSLYDNYCLSLCGYEGVFFMFFCVVSCALKTGLFLLYGVVQNRLSE
jgi:hypothetical protein